MPEPPSILLLHGSDEFAMAEHVDKLCAALGDPASAGMNIARFDGRQPLDFEALNTAINAVPFLASRRIVVLVHPGAAFNAPEARKRFTDLLEKAPPTSTVILEEHDELKREAWLLKWANSPGARAAVHLYNLPKRWEMPQWIESETRRLGGRIDPAAAGRLAEMVGEDTRIAAQELTKLLTYVNFERPVRLADVEQVSLVSAEASVFELVDAIGMGDGKKAQRVLHRLLEDVDAMELWGMVIRQFRLLLLAREMLEDRSSIAEVQKALGIHEFVAQKIYRQAGRFSLPALEAIYHRLLEMDEAAKTSQVPLDLSLDTLIVELKVS